MTPNIENVDERSNIADPKKNFTKMDNGLVRYGGKICGGSTNFLVLATLMTYAYKDAKSDTSKAKAFPSYKRIAYGMDMNVKTIGLAVKELAAKGIIKITKIPSGLHHFNQYEINFSALDAQLKKSITDAERYIDEEDCDDDFVDEKRANGVLDDDQLPF